MSTATSTPSRRRIADCQPPIQQGLALGREQEMRPLIVDALKSLGALAHMRGDRPRARALYRESLNIANYDPPPQFTREALQIKMAASLEGLAALAYEEGDAAGAARLLGAAARRQGLVLTVPPSERTEWEQRLAAVRAAACEAVFQAAWAEGMAMSLEQSVAHGLEFCGPEPGEGEYPQ